MKNSVLILLLFLGLTGCDDFLTKEPLASFQDDDFWTSEVNVRGFAFGYYQGRFSGFGVSNEGGDMYIHSKIHDNFAQTNLPGFAANPVVKGGKWGGYFSNIRRDNIFVDRVERVPFDNEESANHWRGVARFFRAFDYSLFAFDYKNVPYYDYELTVISPDLFRPQDDVFYVVDRILEDYQFASDNVQVHDPKTGEDGLVIIKDVVDAFMSRHLLMLGTKLKYDPATTSAQMERVEAYLKAAKDAAWRVISSGRWNLASNYHGLCSTLDIATTADIKQEMILYRQYDIGTVTHAMMANNRDASIQNQCANKDLIDSYLCSNGLPIHPVGKANAMYKGDKTAEDQMANRDPRLVQTIRPKFLIQGDEVGYSDSGFKIWKFLDEATQGNPEAVPGSNITDAPVMRLGEVMMNYIEAAAELDDMGKYSLTQADLDATINKLRTRKSFGNKLKTLQIMGGKPAVDGVVYDDAERDPEVPSMIWEIRRERRVELVYECNRLDDLKRWRKIDYCNTTLYPKKNMGCYLVKSDQFKNLVLCDENGNVISPVGSSSGNGYIKLSLTERDAQNGNVLERNYWECIPLYEIDYYERNDSHLTQNPGWPQGGAN